tara:strand:- start:32 stop:1138 length:1107 start_codon:yes stop_codon:yes gene_type:complete
MDPILKIYRLLVVLFIIGLLWLIVPFISSILIMLILSFIFTSIFLPSVDALERQIKSRVLSVLFIIGTTIFSIVWFLGVFMTNFSFQIKDFSEKLTQQEVANRLGLLSKKFSSIIPDFLLNLIPNNDEIIYGLQSLLTSFFQNILGLIGTTGNILFFIIMTFIFTIIVLIEYYSFKRSIVNFIPNKFFEVGLRLIYNVEKQVSKYLQGQLLAAATVAILSIFGLQILNKTGANITLIVFIGIIAGFANLIPLVGPFVGMVPAILIAIMNNIGSDVALAHKIFGTIPSPFFIVDIILMFVFVQQIDNNFVTPFLIGESTGLHPLIVMISLLIGGIIMGPIGMLFAVPAAGVIKVIIKELHFIYQNSHLI